MSVDGRPWARALGWALTGEVLPLSGALPDADAIVAALASVGWDQARIADLADRRREDELPWPFPPEPELYRRVGAPAAYHAAVARCVGALGIDGTHRQVRAQRALNADERRLLADVPPHFGHAG